MGTGLEKITRCNWYKMYKRNLFNFSILVIPYL